MILGANYLGRTAKEIFEGNSNVVYGFLDDNKQLHNKLIDEATVLGSTDDDGFLKLIGKKCDAFVAVDDNKLRKNLVKMIQEVRHVQPVNAIHKDGLTWDHISDLQYWNNKAAVLYGVQSIPFNVLVDPDGKVVAENLRGSALEQKLQEVLN